MVRALTFLFLVLGAALVALADGKPSAAAVPAAGAADKKPAMVTISKETTWIIEPLTTDGTPDYVEWLNRKYSQGITPENNAVVLLWQCVGPEKIPKPTRVEYFRRLGVAMPPEKGDYWVGPYAFLRQLRGEAYKEEEARTLFDQYDQAWRRPWTEKEYPLLAQWLARNEKPLRLAVEMSRRSKFYSPLLVPTAKQQPPRLSAVGLAQLEIHPLPIVRDLTRSLGIRAMFRLDQRNWDGAWDDLSAIERLGHLVAQGPTYMDSLIALMIRTSMLESLAALAHEARPTTRQADLLRTQWKGEPPRLSLADRIAESERFQILDNGRNIAQHRFDVDAYLMFFMGGQPDQKVREAALLLDKMTVDPDELLKQLNRYCDRLTEAARTAGPTQRRAALRKFDAELTATTTQVYEQGARLDPTKAAALPPAEAAKFASDTIVALLFAPLRNEVAAMENLYFTRAAMQDLLLTLAAYRSDHGAYPERLEQLQPAYNGVLPRDSFTGADFRYQRTADGFRLYSIGADGKDDGGKGLAEKHDDELIEIPLPTLKVHK